MDREILFKAKTTEKENKAHSFDNVWVEGNLIISNNKYYIHPIANKVHVEGELGKIIVMHEVIPETICRFTGLSDEKSNKKVWEHDVIKYHFGDDVAEIKFGEYQSCFDSKEACHVGFYVDWQKGYLRKDLGYWVKMIDCNVIGNIFDNPELLEVLS